jgi:hypothetical protein
VIQAFSYGTNNFGATRWDLEIRANLANLGQMHKKNAGGEAGVSSLTK